MLLMIEALETELLLPSTPASCHYFPVVLDATLTQYTTLGYKVILHKGTGEP